MNGRYRDIEIYGNLAEYLGIGIKSGHIKENKEIVIVLDKSEKRCTVKEVINGSLATRIL